MRPYYEDGSVTIYHGDCMDVLGSLPPADLIFTSPPYNLGVSAGGGFGHYADEAGLRLRGGGGKWTGGALAHGYDGHGDAMSMADYEEWQREVLRRCWAQLDERGAIFYNHKSRVQAQTLWMPTRLNPDLPLRQIIVWARAGGMNFAPTHYVPTHEWIMVLAKPDWRLKTKGASGIGDVWRVAQEPSDHPAPFPLALPAYAIESAGPSLVIDPFMGSGTTLRAAKDAGVRANGLGRELPAPVGVVRLAEGNNGRKRASLKLGFHGGHVSLGVLGQSPLARRLPLFSGAPDSIASGALGVPDQTSLWGRKGDSR